MLEAFYSRGYEVFNISGERDARQQKWELLKQLISKGERWDYLYVESLSRPSNSRIGQFAGMKLLIREKLDYKIIDYCLSENIPTGFYLRDLHWDFSHEMTHYRGVKGRYLRTMLKYFGREELRFLQQKALKVFTPSQRFSKHLTEVHGVESMPLRPGATTVSSAEIKLTGHSLKVFYVGGATGIYDLTYFLSDIEGMNNVKCDLCIRRAEKAAVHKFAQAKNINIVHTSGSGLIPYMENANIAVYPLPPKDYIQMSFSVKIAEYIANGLPIIAYEGTEVAEFIEKYGIGWVVPYSKGSMADCLKRILNGPEVYQTKQKNVLSIQKRHTWSAVVDKLEANLLGR